MPSTLLSSLLVAGLAVTLAVLWVSNPRGAAPPPSPPQSKPAATSRATATRTQAVTTSPTPTATATPATTPTATAATHCLHLLTTNRNAAVARVQQDCGDAMMDATNATETRRIGSALLLRSKQDPRLAELALQWLQRTATLVPTSADDQSALAKAALQQGLTETALQAVENALLIRLRLKTGLLQTLLHASQFAIDKPENLAWLRDASPQAHADLEVLLSAAQADHRLPLANAVFRILSALRPKDAAFQTAFADFSMSIGLVDQGLTAYLRNLQTQHGLVKGGTILDPEPDKPPTPPPQPPTKKAFPKDDAYGRVMESSLLLLAAGFDSHVVTVSRRILGAKRMEELLIMGDNCGVRLTQFFGVRVVPAAEARKYLDSCVIDAELIPTYVKKGADIAKLANGFGFAVSHDAAALGAPGIWAALVSAGADYTTTNTVGQTAAHIAVIRGSLEVLKNLESKNESFTLPDRFGRTPFDIACMHRWSLPAVADILEVSPTQCRAEFPAKPKSVPEPSAGPKPATTVGGGWRVRRADAKLTFPCEIDTMDGLQADGFLIDYLTVQRPVLVKNALKGPAWKALLAKYSRESVEKELGGVEVAVGRIPYAERFGLDANSTTIAEYLELMDELHAAHLDNIEPPNPPPYIFESVGEGSPLLKLFAYPPLVDPMVTEINTRNVQFYLGPAESGAPMHFHRGAWNALVYGRKRWFLSPPPAATYSTKHPRYWLLEDYPALKANKAVMECVQESGDVVFVPEAWSHAVLNMAESIGIASEFEWGASEFAIEGPDSESQEEQSPEGEQGTSEDRIQYRIPL